MNEKEIDACCDRFELEWKSGRTPDPREYMAQVKGPARDQLCLQLVLIDREYRRKFRREQHTLEDYGRRMGVSVDFLQANCSECDDSASSSMCTLERTVALESMDQSPDFPKITGYTVLREVGRGGMGTVFEAQQESLNRRVALKIVRTRTGVSDEHVQRFQAEAEAAGQMDHPGIVPVFEVGEEAGVHFFSMGLVDGPDLNKQIQEGVIRSRDAARIALGVAKALVHAHAQGVIHRDIKPHNILLDSDGRPRITDFGLAKLSQNARDLTATEQIMGTASYMPPEHATGNTSEAGPSSDIYSTGATLYHCLTGRPPFQAASNLEVLRQVVNEEPIPPRRLNGEIHVDLETICLRCIEKSPTDRFQSAQELAEELTRFLNGESILSRPVSSPVRLLRWCRRRPYAAATTVLSAFLVFSLATAVPLIMFQRQRLRSNELQQELDSKARIRAEELAASSKALADTQSYYVKVGAVRENRLATRPNPGWTWEALDLLESAAKYEVVGKDEVELRSLALDLLATPDLRLRRTIEARNTYKIQVSPKGTYVAFADRAGVPTSRIRVFQTADFLRASERSNPEPVFECAINTVADKLSATLRLGSIFGNEKGPQVEREGFRAIQFSQDESLLLAATRNGNVVLWDLTNKVQQEMFNERFPGQMIERVGFLSREDKLLYRTRAPWTIRTVETKTGKTEDWPFVNAWDFASFSNGTLFVASGDTILQLKPSEQIADRTILTDESLSFANIQSVSDSFLTLQTNAGVQLFEPTTGELGVRFVNDDDALVLSDFCITTDTSVAFAAFDPDVLRLWDGLSGRHLRDIEFAGDTDPKVALARNQNLMFIYSSRELTVYELRGCGLNQEDGHQSLKDRRSPISTIGTGSLPIADFSLGPEGARLATLETQLQPEAGRSRIRLMDVATGEELTRHCLITKDADQESLFCRMTGEHVSILSDQRIAMSSQAPGCGFVLDGNRAALVSDEKIAGVEATLVTKTESRVVAEFDVNGEMFDRMYRPTVCLRLSPEILPRFDRIQMTFYVHSRDQDQKPTRVSEFTLSASQLSGTEWFVASLPRHTCGKGEERWLLEAELIGGVARIEAANDVDSAEIRSSSAKVHFGGAYMLPYLPPSDKGFPLGPISALGGGRMAFVLGYNLHHFDADVSRTGVPAFNDSPNSFARISALDSNATHALAGTNSGLVALIDRSGTVRPMRSAILGENNPRESIAGTAISADSKVGLAGNLHGQLMLYRFDSAENEPTATTSRSTSGISAVALTPDGRFAASSRNDGTIQYWRVHRNCMELLFELPSHRKSTCVRLEFSSHGKKLFYLREGDRGVRCLHIERFRDALIPVGLSWSLENQ